MGQPYLKYYSSDEPKAGGTSQMKLIESYEATSAESSKTFTITRDFSSTAYLVLEIDLATTAALALTMQLNGVTSGYYSDGRRISAAVEVLIDDSNLSKAYLGTAAILAGANYIWTGIIKFFLTKADTNHYLKWSAQSWTHGNNQQMQGREQTATDDITSIKIFTSTSTWKIGTRMSLYEVLR